MSNIQSLLISLFCHAVSHTISCHSAQKRWGYVRIRATHDLLLETQCIDYRPILFTVL